MAKTGTRSYHINLNVRGALLHMSDRELGGMFREVETGKSLTAPAAREWLEEQLAAGRERIPMDSTCANPCPRNGCTGFDYGIDGGCPGHPIAALLLPEQVPA